METSSWIWVQKVGCFQNMATNRTGWCAKQWNVQRNTWPNQLDHCRCRSPFFPSLFVWCSILRWPFKHISWDLNTYHWIDSTHNKEKPKVFTIQASGILHLVPRTKQIFSMDQHWQDSLAAMAGTTNLNSIGMFDPKRSKRWKYTQPWIMINLTIYIIIIIIIIMIIIIIILIIINIYNDIYIYVYMFDFLSVVNTIHSTHQPTVRTYMA